MLFILDISLQFICTSSLTFIANQYVVLGYKLLICNVSCVFGTAGISMSGYDNALKKLLSFISVVEYLISYLAAESPVVPSSPTAVQRNVTVVVVIIVPSNVVTFAGFIVSATNVFVVVEKSGLQLLLSSPTLIAK